MNICLRNASAVQSAGTLHMGSSPRRSFQFFLSLVSLLALLPAIGNVSAQTTYTWNQAGDGSWTVATNWTPTRTTAANSDIMVINNGNTFTITDVPGQTIGRLLIQNNTDVTLSASGGTQTLSIGNGSGDDLVLENGSTLSTDPSLERITMIANSTADISGTFENHSIFRLALANVVATVHAGGRLVLSNNGSVTGATAAKLVFAAGSTYEHARNGGTVPTATWDVASTCLISGFTASSVSGLNQTFGNFVWNCPAQTGNQAFPATTIAGNFEIISTGNDPDAGTEELRMNQATLSVGGNFLQSGGDFRVSNGGNSRTLSIAGDFSLSGGTLLINQGNNVSNGLIEVQGDFSLTGTGILTESNVNAAGTGGVIFNGAADQKYTSGGTVIGPVNFTVNSGSILQMGADDTVVSGSGTFTLSSGATLGITSPDGIDASDPMGNIQTASRIFANDASYRYNGSVAQQTGDGLPTSISNLLLDNASGVTLTQSLQINGVLTFSNGILTSTTTELLLISDGGTVSGASGMSFVSGPVEKTGATAFVFPVGKGGIFAPIQVSASSDMMSNTFLAEYFNGNPIADVGADLEPGMVEEILNNGYWDLAKISGPVTSAINVTLFFAGNGVAAMGDVSNLIVAHFEGGMWTTAGGTPMGDPMTGGEVTSGLVSSFSFFTLGSTMAMNALPVELAAFTATAKGQTVQLDWRTVSELNNAFFDIERSANGRDFERIGKVAGAGTSLAAIDYAFLDETPLKGWNYYRLRQEDFDGTFSYSDVQAVRLENSNTDIRLEVFPNPTSSFLNLKTDGLLAPGDLLEIFDQTGRKMRRFNAAEALNAPLDVSQLPAGVYFIRLQSATGRVQASFVKQ